MKVTRPGCAPCMDTVAEEIPVAFEYNGISHTVMLATPSDLEDFALGFSLSEGIVDSPAQIYDLLIEEGTAGITLHLEIAAACFARLKAHRRNLMGRTGCGLCGTESLAQVMRELSPVADSPAFPLAALYEGIRRLPPVQTLQQLTGAVHAACLLSTDGGLSHAREDVGRHNALDKTLGSMARLNATGALLITSRASFEMVQKSAALGFGILAAVSAPTAAAVRLAEKLNVTLVGFLRGSSCAIYTHAHRLQGSSI
jgi:FdhD protein